MVEDGDNDAGVDNEDDDDAVVDNHNKGDDYVMALEDLADDDDGDARSLL